jgi:threonine/homoserine/homoserine lactone efflux protein
MLLEGILLGLSLSFLIGPLLFAIVQASLEYGFRAGLSVAAGIWAGDVLYVLAIRYALDAMAGLTARPGFQFWAGMAGGLFLLVFGITSLLSRGLPREGGGAASKRAFRQVDQARQAASPLGKPRPRPDGGPTATAFLLLRKGLEGGLGWGYATFWLRGFLINLINPFTIFFWLGIASAVVVPNRWDGQDTAVFFGGMLGTLVLTDTLKAWAAKAVRRFLTPEHARAVQRILGLVLVIFGLVLVGRTIYGSG